MFKYILAIIFFPVCLSAEETRTDSLLKALAKNKKADTLEAWLLNEISWEYTFSDNKLSLDYALEAGKLSASIGYKEGLATAYNIQGINYRSTNQFNKAIDAINKCIEIRIEQGKQNKVAIGILNLGHVYLVNEEYPKAINMYKRTLEICDSLNITYGKSQALTNLAVSYEQIGDYKKALDYEFKALSFNRSRKDTIEEGFALQAIGITFFKQNQLSRSFEFIRQAIKIFENTKYNDALSACYNDLGIILRQQSKYDEALTYYNKALEIAIKADREDDIGMMLHNIGIIYHDKKLYEQALEYQERSLKICLRTGNDHSVAKAYLSMFEIYKERKQIKDALETAQKALVYAEKSGRTGLITDCYEALAYCYAENGNFKEAFKLQKILIQAKDSTFNTETARQLAQVETMYETDKKENEIVILTKEKQLKDEKIGRQRVVNYSVGGGLLLVAGLSLVTYKRYREKKKSNLELQEKNIAITKQKKEIEIQSSIIEEKNKDITDSINYARRIQSSFLPAAVIREKILPDHFIFYKPKDIVSGDFYWIGNNKDLGEDRFILATADCTGHGVPGAFMSIIGVSLLNEIVLKRKIYSPELILNELRTGIIKAVNPEGSTEEGNDGMDISLCYIDRTNLDLKFAGANNGIIIIRNKELIELKADKFPVGKSLNDTTHFSLQSFKLERGDRIYTYTDGFADQFGGSQGKKFKRKQLQEMLLTYEGKISDQKEVVDQALSHWMYGYEQVDDICLIGMEI